MKLNITTYSKLEDLANSFGKNYSVAVDFLFYVFDTFSIAEKKNMLKHCDIGKKKVKDKKSEKNKEEDIIDIELNKLLLDRLENLCKECEKLIEPADALEFLIFVLQSVHKEILEDLIIQYSLELPEFAVEGPHIGEKSLNSSNNPIHVEPNFPGDSEDLFNTSTDLINYFHC